MWANAFRRCSIGLVLTSLVSLPVFANEDDGVIFDLKAGTGAYYSDRGGEKSVSPVIDVSGVLLIGDPDRSKFEVDLALLSAIRDAGLVPVEAEVAARGRYLGEGRFGFEVASVPYRYRRDDNYYELSLIEVSAVARLAEGKGHQLLAKAGINPFTKRVYNDGLGVTRTDYDPVAVGEGWFYRPSDAHVYGAPSYNHDSAADGSYADNRDVYFGGGTRTSTAYTSFETAERSIRIPLSIEYKYRSEDKKLMIQATAYYTLRAGQDSFVQNDDWVDRYEGYVAYSNVRWHSCYDEHGNRYYCDPYNEHYSGEGKITERYRNSTVLDAKGFVGHLVGGKANVNYTVFRSDALEFLLTGQVKAEIDSHVADGGVGTSRGSKRLLGTAGAIVRF